MYAGELDDKIFDEYFDLKHRLKKAIENTVDLYNVDAQFTLRVKRERLGNIVFEPATLKFRRISSGTSVTLAGDILHIAVADFPDISEKIEKLNKKLVENGMQPLPVPSPDSPGNYIKTILDAYQVAEALGIKIKLP